MPGRLLAVELRWLWKLGLGEDVTPQSTNRWAGPVFVWGKRLEGLRTVLRRDAVWPCCRKYLPAFRPFTVPAKTLLGSCVRDTSGVPISQAQNTLILRSSSCLCAAAEWQTPQVAATGVQAGEMTQRRRQL